MHSPNKFDFVFLDTVFETLYTLFIDKILLFMYSNFNQSILRINDEAYNMKTKKIAMIIAQADGAYQRTLIEGVATETKKYGYDLCVFTNFHVTDRHEGVPISHIIGEKNIFNWIPYDQFDGILIALSTLRYDNGFRNTLQKQIASTYHGPVISLDLESDYFDDVTLDDSAAIQQMICHLNKVHGYTDIAFLTGPMYHTHSIRRLNGYLKGLEQCHIPYQKEKVYHGNFWYDSGSDLAEQMIRKGNIPQALVCSNEAMAIGAYRTFLTNGIRIPEDLALTGFDALDEGVENNFHITSMIRNGDDTGRKAARTLIEKITGELLPKIHEKKASFIFWDTCGCGEDQYPSMPNSSLDWLRPINTERTDNFFSNYNYMLENLVACKSFEDLKDRLYNEFTYLGEFNHFTFCLDEHWMDKSSSSLSLDNVNCEFEFDNTTKTSKAPHSKCQNILDFPSSETDDADIYYFVPLHFSGTALGYTILSYHGITIFPDCYSSWTRNLCTGLQFKRVLHLRKEM